MKARPRIFTPKNILFWVFQIIMYMIMNASTIVAILSLFIETTVPKGSLDSKYQHDTMAPNVVLNYFEWLRMKTGMPKELGCIFLFSIIGVFLSFGYTKFLSKIIIRKLDIRKENISQEKELEIKRESLKIEKEKQELDILKIKAEAGLLTEKEIKRLEDRLC